MDFLDVFKNRGVFAPDGLVYGIRTILPDHRTVGGYTDDIETVDFPEFVLFRRRGTGHS